MSDRVKKSIRVDADIDTVYDIWSDFENFPHFMQHVRSVEKTGERMSHWVVEGPLGASVEWDAETTAMEENERIAWQSTSGEIETGGEVTFKAISPTETEVTVAMEYALPSRLSEEVVSAGEPEAWLMDDLQNFKKYVDEKKQQA